MQQRHLVKFPRPPPSARARIRRVGTKLPLLACILKLPYDHRSEFARSFEKEREGPGAEEHCRRAD
jgi:hypothetical protein